MPPYTFKHLSIGKLHQLRRNPRYRDQWDRIDEAIDKLEQKEQDKAKRPVHEEKEEDDPIIPVKGDKQ